MKVNLLNNESKLICMPYTKEKHATYMREYRRTHPEYRLKSKEQLRKWRALNPERVRVHNRRGREHSREWLRNRPGYQAQSVARWRLKYPEKERAHIIARSIALEKDCAACGNIETLERHHPDYSKPLEIVTLCRKCHRSRHYPKEVK